MPEKSFTEIWILKRDGIGIVNIIGACGNILSFF